jgi:hypothetical protein
LLEGGLAGLVKGDAEGQTGVWGGGADLGPSLGELAERLEELGGGEVDGWGGEGGANKGQKPGEEGGCAHCGLLLE